MNANDVLIAPVKNLAEVLRVDFEETVQRRFPRADCQPLDRLLAPFRAGQPAVGELLACPGQMPAVGLLRNVEMVQELGIVAHRQVPDPFRDCSLKCPQVAPLKDSQHRRRGVQRAATGRCAERVREPDLRLFGLAERQGAAGGAVVSSLPLHRFAAPELQPHAL